MVITYMSYFVAINLLVATSTSSHSNFGLSEVVDVSRVLATTAYENWYQIEIIVALVQKNVAPKSGAISLTTTRTPRSSACRGRIS